MCARNTGGYVDYVDVDQCIPPVRIRNCRGVER
jgi:hypothetical protein